MINSALSSNTTAARSSGLVEPVADPGAGDVVRGDCGGSLNGDDGVLAFPVCAAFPACAEAASSGEGGGGERDGDGDGWGFASSSSATGLMVAGRAGVLGPASLLAASEACGEASASVAMSSASLLEGRLA